MKNNRGLVAHAVLSYWRIFRLIFVIFSLFLMGDAFYRWDAFKFYGAFSGFVPSVALISVLWTILAALISLLIWLPSKALILLYNRVKGNIIIDYLLLFVCVYGAFNMAIFINNYFSILHTTKTLIWRKFLHDVVVEYYAPLLEFLPRFVLKSIFVTIAIILMALLAWFASRILEKSVRRIGWSISKNQLFLYLCIFSGTIAVVGIFKNFIMVPAGLTFPINEIVIVILALLLTWLFRGKEEPWNKLKHSITKVPELITPLVCIFGIAVILSLPIVVYSTWFKPAGSTASVKTSKLITGETERPNIILVTFDALTSRDMSVYGYRRPTTPFIRKWAKTASLFTNLKADGNYTSPTTASIMTGKRTWTHQVLQAHAFDPVRADIENLALELRKRGYYNMAFVANKNASVIRLDIADSFDIAPLPREFITPFSLYSYLDRGLSHLFEESIQFYNWFLQEDFILMTLSRKFYKFFTESPITEVPPEKVFSAFFSAVADKPSKPFFAWIHIMPPHNPFIPPEPYMGTFDSSPKLRTRNDLSYTEWSDETIKSILRARYDEFILYCDKQFEDFIEQLAHRNMLKNSVMIMSADHGEIFDHDFLFHGGPHLYEPLTHIPLIIKEPNQTEGKIINDVVAQVDIPATILDLVRIPVPSWMEGRSLVPLIRGMELPLMPAFSMSFYKNEGRGHLLTKGTVAVWEGDYKLIHYLTDNKSLLYNLKKDPGELDDLFDEEKELGQRLLAQIKDGLKKANDRIRNENH